MHIRLLNKGFEMVDRPGQFGFGVLADGGRDLEIPAVDQKLHRIAGRFMLPHARKRSDGHETICNPF